MKYLRLGRRIYFTDLEHQYLYYRQEYDFMPPRFDEVRTVDGIYAKDKQVILDKLRLEEVC